MLAAAWGTAAAHGLALGAWLTGRRVWQSPRAWPRWGVLLACHSLVIADAFRLDSQLGAWPVRVSAKAARLCTSAVICARCASVSPFLLLKVIAGARS